MLKYTFVWGGPGHEHEYCVHIEGYDWKNYIPIEWSEKLEEILGKRWLVSNRGTRLEIMVGWSMLSENNPPNRIDADDAVIDWAIKLMLVQVSQDIYKEVYLDD